MPNYVFRITETFSRTFSVPATDGATARKIIEALYASGHATTDPDCYAPDTVAVDALDNNITTDETISKEKARWAILH